MRYDSRVEEELSRRAYEERIRRLAAERLELAERFEALAGTGPVPESPGAEEYVAGLEAALARKDDELRALQAHVEYLESVAPRSRLLRRAFRARARLRSPRR